MKIFYYFVRFIIYLFLIFYTDDLFAITIIHSDDGRLLIQPPVLANLKEDIELQIKIQDNHQGDDKNRYYMLQVGEEFILSTSKNPYMFTLSKEKIKKHLDRGNVLHYLILKNIDSELKKDNSELKKLLEKYKTGGIRTEIESAYNTINDVLTKNKGAYNFTTPGSLNNDKEFLPYHRELLYHLKSDKDTANTLIAKLKN